MDHPDSGVRARRGQLRRPLRVDASRQLRVLLTKVHVPDRGAVDQDVGLEPLQLGLHPPSIADVQLRSPGRHRVREALLEVRRQGPSHEAFRAQHEGPNLQVLLGRIHGRRRYRRTDSRA